MQKNWVTKESDLRVATNIIRKYLDNKQAGTLGLFELCLDNKEVLDIKLSAWVLELVEYFYQLYGKDQGDFVTQMVLSKFLTNGHTIH